MTDSNQDFTRRRLLQGAVATWFLSVTRVGFAESSQVIAVRIWPSSTYTRVALESKTPLKYKYFSLNNPDRLVIDIENTNLNSVLKGMGKQVKGNDPFLKNMRVGQFDGNTVRVVLELKPKKVSPKVFNLAPVAGFKNRLVVDLYPPVGTVEADPLLALLEDYNKGDLDRSLPPPESAPRQDKTSKSAASHSKAQGATTAQRNSATTKTQNSVPAKTRRGPLVIMLDPGHGGEDSGAIGKMRTREKDIVLKIARRLSTLIKKQPNMRVYMTRNEDVFIPLKVRVAKARKQRADLFVSIHADAFTSRSVSGSTVFALSTKGATSAAARYLAQTQNESDQIGGVSRSGDQYLDHTMFDMVQTATINDSLKFGKQVLNHLGKVNKLHKNSVDQAGFAVLKAPDIPSILVETAFISNVEEERKLRTDAFQQKVAESILAGIKAYFDQGGEVARRG